MVEAPLRMDDGAGSASVRVAARTLDRLALVVAASLSLSMLAAALHDASQAWDVCYYHLPFAGRLAGLLPSSEYVFSKANRARFEGFPLLAELAQGVLWRVTGRAESVNLVAFSSVGALAWFGARELRIPWHVSVVGLLAIPLVHAHATSGYVDLPANAALTVLVLLAIQAWDGEGPPPVRALALALLCAAVAANIKPMLHPVVLAALGALAIRSWRPPRGAPASLQLVLIALALPVIFATPLKNLFLHGNPYFPLRLTVLGRALPGDEAPYSSSPVWLEAAPGPVRFLCSILEIGLPPIGDARRWTIDQWRPPDDPGYRMGGFFHAYVVASVVLLACRAARGRSRRSRAALAGFALLTVVISVLPQAHELRYYMAWMMVLVMLNGWIAVERGARPRPTVPGESWPTVLALIALTVVLVSTRAAYAYPSGSSFHSLVQRKVDERSLESVRDGDRVCVAREPFDVLWAPVFHPGRRYVLKEAEAPDECTGFRELP